jgi:hypothetical protein
MTSLLRRKIVFVSKLSTIAAAIAACSYASNTSPLVRRILSLVPFTGKQAYCDGVHTPLTRGFLHGGMALFHFARAASTGLASHSFLVLQYVASFILHNVPLRRARELQVGSVDNLAIASHICLLSWLGLPPQPSRLQLLMKSCLLASLGHSFFVGLTNKEGTRSWSYKASLLPIFAAGIFTWHSSGKLYLSGTPRIPFIYFIAFGIFAAHKKGIFEEDKILSAVTYDMFHGLQVVATLATLSQVGQL